MNILWTMFTFLFLLANLQAYCKVLILTTAYNRPDFIELQDKHFKCFLSDDYEFVVFNDAPSEYMCQQIEQTCQTLGLNCKRIPQHTHYSREPSGRTAHAIQYTMDTMGFDHDDLVVLIDSDMFLIKPISFRELLSDNHFSAVPQRSVQIEYMWNGLMVFNMPQLPDKRTLKFAHGRVDGVPTDTGGYTLYYLKAHPELKWLKIYPQHIYDFDLNLLPEGLDDATVNVIKSRIKSEFIHNFHFFHYQSGGNWNHLSGEEVARKSQIVFNYLEQLRSQSTPDD